MKLAIVGFLLATTSLAQVATPQLPLDDAIRIAEFYRLAAQLDDQLWSSWSKIPAPLLLITGDMEFLTHHPAWRQRNSPTSATIGMPGRGNFQPTSRDLSRIWPTFGHRNRRTPKYGE